jgi:hypothetical protein
MHLDNLALDVADLQQLPETAPVQFDTVQLGCGGGGGKGRGGGGGGSCLLTSCNILSTACNIIAVTVL